MLTLGQTLKKLRVREGFNQTEAAQQAQLRQGYLSKIESDQAWPSYDVLDRICKCYRTQASSVLIAVEASAVKGELSLKRSLILERSHRSRKALVAAVAGGLVFVLIIIAAISKSSPTPEHTSVSIELHNIPGYEALTLFAEYGGLKIDNINLVKGELSYFKVDNEPWDIAFTRMAKDLGYRAEIQGGKIYLHSM